MMMSLLWPKCAVFGGGQSYGHSSIPVVIGRYDSASDHSEIAWLMFKLMSLN